MGSDFTATQIDVAAHLDLSTRRVADLVNEGIIPPPVGGKYDLTACRREYLRHLRERAEARRKGYR